MTQAEKRHQYQVEWMRTKRAIEKAERLKYRQFLLTVEKALRKMDAVSCEVTKQRILKLISRR